MPRLIDLTGQKYGKLSAIERDCTKKLTYWICICECGNKTSVSRGNLRSGLTKTCGKCLKTRRELTQELLKEILYYNKNTGNFHWIKPSHFTPQVKGRIAGSVHNGYISITIDGTPYRAHRLAFLWMTGRVPTEVDHVNRKRNDNKWCNIREVTHTENMKNQPIAKNNKTGVSGISIRKDNNKFMVKIGVKGNPTHLLSTTDFFEACCARKSAEKKYGYHKNHGVLL